MRKVIKYEVVYGNIEALFVERVNQMIQEGWEPLGGVSVCVTEKTLQAISHQAMVKYEEPKTHDPNWDVPYGK